MAVVTHACGTTVDDTSVICPGCGGMVEPVWDAAPPPVGQPTEEWSAAEPSRGPGAAQAPASEQITCPVPWCGRPSPAGSIECDFCGEPLTGRAAPDGAPPVASWEVVLPDGTRQRLLPDTPLELGREVSDAAVRASLCDYDGVSRRHARVTWKDQVLLVEDLGSLNGTWVDADRVDTRREIALAPTTLRLGASAHLQLTPGQDEGAS